MPIGEDISNAEGGAYLALGLVVLGLVVYLAYEASVLGESIKTSFCTFFGGDPQSCADSGSSTGNTYSNALNQTVSNPLTTAETIVGLNQDPNQTSAIENGIGSGFSYASGGVL